MADKFDPFVFMRERHQGIKPNEVELKRFDLYMSQMILSMDNSFINDLNEINTPEFFRLPKHIQCMAFTSYNGKNIDMSWKKTKVSTVAKREEQLQKIMRVYDISYNEAVSCIRFKTVDLDEVEELHQRLYNNSAIKFRKKRAKKKK